MHAILLIPPKGFKNETKSTSTENTILKQYALIKYVLTHIYFLYLYRICGGSLGVGVQSCKEINARLIHKRHGFNPKLTNSDRNNLVYTSMSY